MVQCKHCDNKKKLTKAIKLRGFNLNLHMLGGLEVDHKAHRSPNSIPISDQLPKHKQAGNKQTNPSSKIRSKDQGTKVRCEFTSDTCRLFVFTLLMEPGG